MSDITLVKNVRTLIAAGTSNAAGGAKNGNAFDLRTAQGGTITAKITNGATAPNAPARLRITAAHDSGLTPIASPPGADWKTLTIWTAGVDANGIYEMPAYQLPPGVMHVCCTVDGNTAQAVVAEVLLSEITKAVSA